MRRFMLFLAMAFCLAVPMTVLGQETETAPAVTAGVETVETETVAGDETVTTEETPAAPVEETAVEEGAAGAGEPTVTEPTETTEETEAGTVIPDIEEDLGKFLTVMLEAFKARNWALGFTMFGMLLLWALRKYGPRLIPALATEGGSVVVTLLLSAVGSLATAVYNGADITFALVWKALSVGMLAIGGFAALKHLAGPILEKLKAKIFPAKPAPAPAPTPEA